MKKIVSVMAVVVFLGSAGISFADRSGVDIIKQGLLGAGTGAIASSVSGGRSGDIWIGALTGAGVNVVGGTILDMITESETTVPRQTGVRYEPYGNAEKAYKRKIYYRQKEVVPVVNRTYSEEFIEGYKEGYKEGYLLGYREAIKDLTENR